jgi:sec-independent protein translocase protein TatC
MKSRMDNSLAPHWVRFLTELRRRLLYSLVFLGVVFAILVYFANDLYTVLALPLLKHLPHGQGLIATNVVASFFVPVELAFVLSLFLAVPYFLYQFWVFIAPALYTHERHLLWPLLLISTLLFYVGIAFAYFVILPLLFGFLTSAAPKGVAVMPDISAYLDFALKLFFTFGLVFEVPVVTIVLVWSGITTREALIKARPYVIVGAFIVGMLLAPPDVLSQTLLAVPLWLLFELGLFLSPLFLTARVSQPEEQ